MYSAILIFLISSGEGNWFELLEGGVKNTVVDWGRDVRFGSEFYLMFLARFLGCVWFAVRPGSLLIECFHFLADYCWVRAASERVTRRGESFSRVRQNRANERKALLAECHSLNLFVTFTLARPLDFKRRELIFSIVSSARAWGSVILAGKRGSRRHSTRSFSESVLVAGTSY